LDSALAPAAAAGKTMYWTSYNDKLNAAIGFSGNGEETKFPSTTGGLDLQDLFFIVNDGTASAAELTMNNLKPYLTVKLVGDTTYGKPVGFIGATLQSHHNGQAKYLADLYAINFETKNSQLQGGYFTGIVPDQLAEDFVDVPFGNMSDENLSYIFHYITNGNFRSNARQVAPQYTGRLKQPGLNTRTKALRFNGMIDFREKKVK
ncbi:MAG TPA: S41 family peptidase, partial [Chitinophaga sp.]